MSTAHVQRAPTISALIREIIKVTHEAVGSDPKIINVVVYEIEPSNMAVNGEI
jgi:4-oxalocrotonate tautomerase